MFLEKYPSAKTVPQESWIQESVFFPFFVLQFLRRVQLTFSTMDESLESWRSFFKGAGTDIFTVIEHAILVAQCESPIEFRGRRGEIVERLYTPASHKCLKCDSVTPVEHTEVNHSIQGGGNRCNGISGCGAEALNDKTEEENQLLQEVVRIKRILDDADESDMVVFESLKKLEVMQVTVEILRETLIGQSVRALRRSRSSRAIRSTANRLRNQWTLVVDEWLASTGAAAVAGREGAEPVQPSSDVRREDSPLKETLVKKDDTKNSLLPRLHKQPASDEEVKARMEVSKRKLQEGYRQVAEAKRRRTIQVLPIEDIPTDLPRPKPPHRSRRNRSHR